jgi:hypothetical protein
VALDWKKEGKWHTALWKDGSVQVFDTQRELVRWKWSAFDRGALIGSGIEGSLAKAKAAAEAAISQLDIRALERHLGL